MTIRTAKLIVRQIREEISRAAAPHKVDRDKCIIYGVKVVHRKSVNTHGVPGAKSSEYAAEALSAALPLYEGLLVNVDHPPKERPGKERSAYDRVAKLFEVKVGDGGDVFANLQLLPSHHMTPILLDAAELMPEAFALSHNAVGKGEVVNGVYLITEIPEVRSVDVVADGGTNVSLFEGRTTMVVKKGLRKIIRESKIAEKLKKRLIREGDEYAPEVMDDMEEEEGAAPGWKDHLANMVACLVGSGDPDDHDKAMKAMKAMKPVTEDEEEEEEPVEEDEEDEEEVEEDEEETKPRGKENTKDAKASKESPLVKSRESRAEIRRELRHLKAKDAVRDLCEALEFRPSKTQLKALLALKTEADRKTLIQESKTSARVSAPRSSGGRSLTESRNESKPASARAWGSRLLGKS